MDANEMKKSVQESPAMDLDSELEIPTKLNDLFQALQQAANNQNELINRLQGVLGEDCPDDKKAEEVLGASTALGSMLNDLIILSKGLCWNSRKAIERLQL